MRIIIFLLLVAFLSKPAQSATENNAQNIVTFGVSNSFEPTPEECAPKKLPPWPLQIMEKEEKEGRLRFFLGLYEWKVSRSEGMGSNELCDPLLTRLKSLDESVKILERINQAPKNFSCKNIHDMTRYATFSAEASPALKPDEKWSSELTMKEKEEKSDFFLRRPSSQFSEYYNLSQYFGENTYGMIDEAVARHYHPRHVQKMCLRGWDAYFQGGALTRVFNTKNCSSYFIPITGSSARLFGQEEQHDSTPDFTAFIEIDQKPYSLQLNAGTNWNNFANILSKKNIRPAIIVIPLQDPSLVVAPVPATTGCAYGISGSR